MATQEFQELPGHPRAYRNPWTYGEADRAVRALIDWLKTPAGQEETKPRGVAADCSFVQYLYDFWSPESEYVRKLNEVSRKLIRAWKLWAAESGLSGRKIKLIVSKSTGIFIFLFIY
jgi:hypothetical protein